MLFTFPRCLLINLIHSFLSVVFSSSLSILRQISVVFIRCNFPICSKALIFHYYTFQTLYLICQFLCAAPFSFSRFHIFFSRFSQFSCNYSSFIAPILCIFLSNPNLTVPSSPLLFFRMINSISEKSFAFTTFF